MEIFGVLIVGIYWLVKKWRQRSQAGDHKRLAAASRGNPGRGRGLRCWRYSLTLVFASNCADMPILRGTEFRARGR
ncbi:hypothetical protein ACJJI4_23900 (plasmid) [Microbulbifer sp. TRSA002]|uniref:hypothetical protein n=1 Tax=Microbulbifer sp. TRSA002 TaxID=3243382 RepID=UPI004039D0BC